MFSGREERKRKRFDEMDGRKRLSLKRKQGNDWLDEDASKRNNDDIMIIDPSDRNFESFERKVKKNLHRQQERNPSSSHSTQSTQSQTSKPENDEPNQSCGRLLQAMMSESLVKTGGYKSLPSSKQKAPSSEPRYKSLPSSCLRCALIRSQPLITYDSANALFKNQREISRYHPNSYARHTGLQRNDLQADNERELNLSKFHHFPTETMNDYSKSEERMKFASSDNKGKEQNFDTRMKHFRKENEKCQNNVASNQQSGKIFVGKSLGRATCPELSAGTIYDNSKFDSQHQSSRVGNMGAFTGQSEKEINEVNDLEEDFDFDLGLDELIRDLPEATFLKTSSSASKPTRTVENVEKGDQSLSLKRIEMNNKGETSNNLQAEKGMGDDHSKQESFSRKRPQQFDKARTKDSVYQSHEKRNSGYSDLIDNGKSRYTPINSSTPRKQIDSGMSRLQSPSLHRENITDNKRENGKANRVHLGHTNSASLNRKDGDLSQQKRHRVPIVASASKTASQEERKIKKSEPDIQSFFKPVKDNMKSTSTAARNPHLSTGRLDQNNLGDASCPMCQMKFPRGWTEFKRNNHASVCMADEIWIDDEEDELFAQVDLT